MTSTSLNQSACTIMAPVAAARLEALRALLERIGTNIDGQQIIPFEKFTTLHFCRFYLVDTNFAAAGCRVPHNLLVFSVDFDGAWPNHLSDWLQLAPEGLHMIFGHCVDYPASKSFDPGSFREYLRDKSIPIQTWYVGSASWSVARIRQEQVLRAAVEAYVDQRRGDPHWLQQTAESMREDILANVKAALPAALPPPLPRSVAFYLVIAGLILAIAIPSFFMGAGLGAGLGYDWLRAGCLLLGLEVLLLAAGMICLRLKEARDPVIPIKVNFANAQKVAQREDFIVQNQMSILTPVKPGLLRQAVLRAVLALINLAARLVYNRGDLAGIPSIHFARWFVFDQGRWMLFQSNYDGSWQSYLGDFIDRQAPGLTAIWSNTREFPATRWLFTGGATDEQRFKAWVRDRQIVTQIWYSAYPDLSKENIANNGQVALGLQNRTAVPADVWLGYLQGLVPAVSLSRPVTTRTNVSQLEFADIQGIIPFGYDHLDWAYFVHLRIDDEAAAKRWLANLMRNGRVQSASQKAGSRALNLGFTVSGLRRLGLTEESLRSFSREFYEGMVETSRSRALGDDGVNDPAKWDWGGCPATTPDLLLMLYATSELEMEVFLTEVKDQFRAAAMAVVAILPGRTLFQEREHFGFRDGIANPVIAGRGPAPKSGEQVLPAGEFVLGYRNQYGRLPFSPTVPNSGPTAGLLRPSCGSPPARDFGRNGSYLAYRQIEQNVHAFWKYLRSQASGPNPSDEIQYLGAKLVGRWMNGSPLVLHPEKPGSSENPSNSFLYQKGDARGMKCPFGSHIRRANPRDSLVGASMREALTVSQRHHLLRRGMSYGPQVSEQFDIAEILSSNPDGKERGLNFICFNADLSRQFEFVQQTWIANPKFGGLANDGDPLVSSGATDFTLPACPVRRHLPNLTDFTRIRGGAYYFVPGLSALQFLSQ